MGFLGGFESHGRIYDCLPFKIIWANDINEVACETYRRNIGAEIHCGDIWKLMQTLPRRADVVIGGFPCQDVSINGRGAGEEGRRTTLYRAMLEVVRRLQPRVFVAENVKGLLLERHAAFREKILADFTGLGYKVSHHLYLAADYGVPQMRERVFIAGTRGRTKPFRPPTPPLIQSKWLTAKDAIKDLESLPEDRERNHIWSKAKRNTEQGSRTLQADRPAATIRAECHGNIQFHYCLTRRLSMREAMRFQSFPDVFTFACGIRQMERQIGNAVPPVLGWHIAHAVRECLL